MKAKAINRNKFRIDCMQYSNWSEKIFHQLREGSVDAVHVTIAYHENFREMVANIEQWNKWFAQYNNLIVKAVTGEDIRKAKQNNKTAIIFGFQNSSPIEDDINLIEIVHLLGVRFMQLSYNNQSLLATGCYERFDSGITRMGKEVIKEMNRVGLVIDMSHSADKSTLQTIELSERPIAITHANPKNWMPTLRNKSDVILKELANSDGMFGFSLYPHHLKEKSSCSLNSFCRMIANTADLIGVRHIGIGTDLCKDQPNEVVEWMRVGRWTNALDYGEGSANFSGFPDMPEWFKDSRDFDNIYLGLADVGFNTEEIALIMGENWLRFFDKNFNVKN